MLHKEITLNNAKVRLVKTGEQSEVTIEEDFGPDATVEDMTNEQLETLGNALIAWSKV